MVPLEIGWRQYGVWLGAAEESGRNEAALRQDSRARVNKHHANFLKRWWQLSWPREDMIAQLQHLSTVHCMRPAHEAADL